MLQVGPLKPSLAQTLQDDYAAYVLPDEPAERDVSSPTHGGEIRAVVTSGRTGVDAALMAALPNLGAVVNFGVGYDTTDVDAAAARGVVVSNTPDVLTDCVADTAVGLMIDTLRQFSASDRYVRAGRWPVDGNYPLTRQVSNTRVGIIGLGRIGSAIAKRLSAFGCTISYHNRHEVEGSAYTYVGSPAELAAAVDVLVVAAAGGSGTQKLVSREVIDALGPRGYLINIARGSVVDEEALVVGVGRRPVGGRGPGRVRGRAERARRRCCRWTTSSSCRTSASGTVETRAAMEELTLRNLNSFLESGRLVTPVPMPVAASR